MKDFIETVKSLDWLDIIHLHGWFIAGGIVVVLFKDGWS